MTGADLRDRGTRICQRLSQAVSELVPEGIGCWPEAWDIVAKSDADFMLALAMWEADPTDESAAAVKVAYGAILKAWRLAATQYDLNTRPTSTLADEDHRAASGEGKP